MENITINELQLIKAGAIIRVSEELLETYRKREKRSEDMDEYLVYQDLIREEEYRLEMIYRLLRVLGLDYDADTGLISKKEGEEDA